MSLNPFDKFWRLFEGRTDAIGSDEGGCIRHDVMRSYDWRGGHWLGSRPIGVYPMVPEADGEWWVKWGCVDLDINRPGKNRYDYETEDDAHVAAVNLQHTLHVCGITSWVEATRSRGRHVWVFMDTWVSAATMRRALMVACDVADVPPTEVNPKNERFPDTDTLGNYVRLPYPGPDLGRGRYMIDERGAVLRDEFIRKAWETRNTPYALNDLAALWQPPTPRVQLEDYGTYDGNLDGDIPPYIRAVLNQGPITGEDRSGWLYWLAGKCRDEGLSPEAAFEVVREADTVYTHKYVIRKDGIQRIADMIERQYA